MLAFVVEVTRPRGEVVFAGAFPQREDERDHLLVLAADGHVTGVAGVGVHADRGLEVTVDLLVLAADPVGLDHVLALDERDAEGLGFADRDEGHRSGLTERGPLGGVQRRSVEFVGERQLHVRSRVGGAQGGREGEETEELFHGVDGERE